MREVTVTPEILRNVGAIASLKIDQNEIIKLVDPETGQYNLDEIIGITSAMFMSEVVNILFDGDVDLNPEELLDVLKEVLLSDFN